MVEPEVERDGRISHDRRLRISSLPPRSRPLRPRRPRAFAHREPSSTSSSTSTSTASEPATAPRTWRRSTTFPSTSCAEPRTSPATKSVEIGGLGRRLPRNHLVRSRECNQGTALMISPISFVTISARIKCCFEIGLSAWVCWYATLSSPSTYLMRNTFPGSSRPRRR